MPQLDPNNFTYQYIGIITLLTAVYILLSYVVLPIILRLMLVRNSFLTAKQNLSDLVNSVAPEQQFIISLKTPINSTALTNQLIGGFSSVTSNVSTLLITKLASLELSKTSPSSLVPLLSTFGIDYLILLLTTEIDDSNE